MTVKDFLDTNDFTKDQLLDMIELSRVLKRCVKAGYYPELLNQEDIMDGKKTVREVLTAADPELKIVDFKRFTLKAE